MAWVEIAGGDRDCSSAVISAYRAAGLDVDATYTGNMRRGFLDTGLFEEWDTSQTSAQRGDIYLNVENHTAMCIDDGTGAYGYDALGEFSGNSFGGITGDQVGDQTGGESSIHAFYDFPWDCTLHCTDRDMADRAAQVMEHLCTCPNHGYAQDARWGDGTTESIEVDGDLRQPATTPDNQTATVRQPRYRVYIREEGWLPWMRGMESEDGSSDDFAGCEGCWIYGFEAEGLGKSGWVKAYRADGTEDDGGVKDSPITGLVVYYDTENPDSTGFWRAKYRAHWLGADPDWGKWEYDDEDDGAGKDEQSPLDMVQLTLAR